LKMSCGVVACPDVETEGDSHRGAPKAGQKALTTVVRGWQTKESGKSPNRMPIEKSER